MYQRQARFEQTIVLRKHDTENVIVGVQYDIQTVVRQELLFCNVTIWRNYMTGDDTYDEIVYSSHKGDLAVSLGKKNSNYEDRLVENIAGGDCLHRYRLVCDRI